MEVSHEVNRERVKELATELEVAFSWRETEEGSQFWMDIQDRLLRISERGH